MPLSEHAFRVGRDVDHPSQPAGPGRADHALDQLACERLPGRATPPGSSRRKPPASCPPPSAIHPLLVDEPRDAGQLSAGHLASREEVERELPAARARPHRVPHAPGARPGHARRRRPTTPSRSTLPLSRPSTRASDRGPRRGRPAPAPSPTHAPAPARPPRIPPSAGRRMPSSTTSTGVGEHARGADGDARAALPAALEQGAWTLQIPPPRWPRRAPRDGSPARARRRVAPTASLR